MTALFCKDLARYHTEWGILYYVRQPWKKKNRIGALQQYTELSSSLTQNSVHQGKMESKLPLGQSSISKPSNKLKGGCHLAKSVYHPEGQWFNLWYLGLHIDVSLGKMLRPPYSPRCIDRSDSVRVIENASRHRLY